MSHSTEGIDELRRVFSESSAHARPTEACPEPERLWAACHGELPATETRDVVDHTAACAVCAEAWRLAIEIDDVPAGAREVSSRAWKVWGGLAAAAAVAALALLGLQQIRRPGEPEAPVFRESEQTGVRALVSEDRPLPRERCLLRWSSPVEGARFDVHVATEALAVVAQARGLTEAEFLVPVGALDGLPPGAKLLWQVESVSPDGERIESRTFIATLE